MRSPLKYNRFEISNFNLVKTPKIWWRTNNFWLFIAEQYVRSQYAAISIKDGEHKGEWVATWAELKIEYKDGRGPVKIWANSNYKVENGKIVKSLTFYNEADVLRQLGYVFINPNEL